jgi:hypothetical protein
MGWHNLLPPHYMNRVNISEKLVKVAVLPAIPLIMPLSFSCTLNLFLLDIMLNLVYSVLKFSIRSTNFFSDSSIHLHHLEI